MNVDRRKVYWMLAGVWAQQLFFIACVWASALYLVRGLYLLEPFLVIAGALIVVAYYAVVPASVRLFYWSHHPLSIERESTVEEQAAIFPFFERAGFSPTIIKIADGNPDFAAGAGYLGRKWRIVVNAKSLESFSDSLDALMGHEMGHLRSFDHFL